jgi:hypothetical protein
VVKLNDHRARWLVWPRSLPSLAASVALAVLIALAVEAIR